MTEIPSKKQLNPGLRGFKEEPYQRGSLVATHGAELFIVNPKIMNDGTLSPTGKAIPGYQYRLPLLQHNFPVRQIIVHTDATLNIGSLSPAVNIEDPANYMITLCKADGTYLIQDIPGTEFVPQPGAVADNIQLIFADDFWPDNWMSWLVFTTDRGHVAAIEYRYAI